METLTNTIYKSMALLISMAFPGLLIAQPANNLPCSAIELTVAGSCSFTGYSNATATASAVPDPGCAGYMGGDVWFSIIMPTNGYHVTIELSAGSMLDGGMAVYEGIDCNTLTLVSCDDNSGTGNMPSLTIDDACNFQYAGQRFWVRVWENGNDSNGTFDICAYAQPPAPPSGAIDCNSNPIPGNTCCDAILLTDLLDGYCANTTGFTAEPAAMSSFCANIENNFWIAFNAAATSAMIEFTSSNCTGGQGVQAAIFETMDCSNFVRVSNCSNPNMVTTDTLIANSLTIGETYYIMVDGWIGDYCDVTFRVIEGVEETHATASDLSICQGDTTTLSLEGLGIGPFTYSWAPTASLIDNPTSATPRAKPLISTNYTVTLTGPSGSSTYSVSVTVTDNVPDMILLAGETSVCDNSTGMQYSVSANNAETYSWTVTGGTIVGAADGSSITVDWGTADGTVCVDVGNQCGVVGPNCMSISTLGKPNITAQNPSAACAPDVVNLATVSVSNSGGSSGFLSYHANQTDAEAGTPTLSSPIVTTSGTYWIRMQSAPGCYDVTSVDVVVEDPQISITQPAPRCAPNTVDLDNIIINETNGFGGGSKTYYTDSLDASVKLNALSNTVIDTAGVFYVRYETSNGCFDIEAIYVDIDPGPDLPDLIQPTPLCPGSSIDLDTISLPIASGVTITSKYFYTSFVLAQFGIPAFAMTSTIVNDDNSYWVRMETPLGCFDIAEINIDIATVPTASISGGGTVCQGDSIDLVLSFTGSGPFDITYNDGTGNFNLTNISNGHIERVQVNTNTTYALVDVIDQTGCTGTINGSPVSAMINPAPSASISGGGNLCEGALATLTFNFSGTGPFDATYTDDQANTYQLTDVSDGHQATHTLNTTTTFTLLTVTDNIGCSGTISGSAAFTIFSPITTTNLSESCNATKTGYTVSFDISGGDANSYMVNGGTGSLVGNTFTSTEIAANTPYSFTISDASGCPAVVVDGIQECTCITSAGTMDVTSQLICASATASVNHNGDAVLDGAANDLLQFVLHDNAGGSLGTVFAIGNSPDFGLLPGMMTGVTYYISPIAGPDNGNGDVDQSHACFDIAPGTPIQFQEEPELSLSGTASICPGDSTDLLFIVLAGVPPFDIVINDGVQDHNLDDITNGDTWRVSPGTNTSYTIVSVVDNSTAACTGIASGTAQISLLDIPSVNNLQRICDGSNTQFQIVFEISGGDPSSYQINGDPGAFDTGTNTFTSDWIANEGSYYFEVSDNGNCEAVIISGSHKCDCTTQAGNMLPNVLWVCENETAVATYIADASFLDVNDTMGYVLHDSPDMTLGNMYFTNTIPEFDYDPVLSFGTTYYISAVVGNDDGSGFPVLDINLDPCLSIAIGQPVVFYPEPTAAISGNATICEGEPASISFSLTGMGPFDVVLSDGNNTITFDDLNDGDSRDLTPSTTTTYTLVSVNGSDPSLCPGLINPTSSSVTIEVLELPYLDGIQVNCNDEGTAYQISLTIAGGSTGTYQIAGDSSMTLTGNTFTSSWYTSGAPYYFELTDGSPCPPVIISDTEYCQCTPDIRPSISIREMISCNGAGDGSIEVANENGQAPFTFTWSNGQSGTDLQNLDSGWYTVSMTDANNCLSIDSVYLSEPEAITATIEADSTSCHDTDDGQITFSNISGGTGAYTLYVGDTYSYLDSTFHYLSAGTYTVRVTDAEDCSWSDTISISSPAPFSIDLGADTTINRGGTAEISVNSNSNIDSIHWMRHETINCESCLDQIVQPLFTTRYQVTAYNENGCVAEDEVHITVSREYPVYIPTAFSPNGDGENDVFTIYGGVGVEQIKLLRVYDRWGAQLFEVTDIAIGDETNGWDGLMSGQRMPIGVYVFYAEIGFEDGSSEIFKGDISLLSSQ